MNLPAQKGCLGNRHPAEDHAPKWCRRIVQVLGYHGAEGFPVPLEMESPYLPGWAKSVAAANMGQLDGVVYIGPPKEDVRAPQHLA